MGVYDFAQATKKRNLIIPLSRTHVHVWRILINLSEILLVLIILLKYPSLLGTVDLEMKLYSRKKNI